MNEGNNIPTTVVNSRDGYFKKNLLVHILDDYPSHVSFVKQLLNPLNEVVRRNRELLSRHFGDLRTANSSELVLIRQLRSTLPAVRQTLHSSDEHLLG